MKKVHIKFLNLVNVGVGMPLKIRSGGKIIARIQNGDSCTIEGMKGERLKFNFDIFYSASIHLQRDDSEEFILVTYFCREYFPAILLDLFKKLLIAKPVSEQEFNTATFETYKKRYNPRQDFDQDVSVLVVGFLLSIIYTFLPFNLLKDQANNRDLSFFIGVMGIIGFAMLIQQHKIIQLKEYKARVLVFSALSIMLDIILPLSAFMQFTLLLTTGLLVLRVLMMKTKTLGKVSPRY